MQEIEGEQATTPQDVSEKIRVARQANKEHVTITFGRPQMSATTSEGIPQMHFDQLNVVAHHLHTMKTQEDQWNQLENTWLTGDNDANVWPPISAEAITEAATKGLAMPKLSRKKLKDAETWPKWRKQEWVS